jgi:hypothetical protein
VVTLVAHAVALEAEEGAELVHEVLVVAPVRVGRRAEAPHLREAEGGLLGEEVVDGEDVVGIACRRGGGGDPTRRGASS